MASYTGMRYSGLGYMSYGVPAQVASIGRGSPYQPAQSPDYGAPVITQPVTGHTPPLTLSWSRFLPPVFAHPTRPVVGRVATGNGPRWMNALWGVFRPGSAAQTPQTAAIGAVQQSAVKQQTIPYHTPGPNSNTALFGRPGFTYSLTKPSFRTGPVPKLAPGTGLTNASNPDNRSLGFQPSGYGSKQHMPMQQFDYTPPTDPTFDVGDNPMAKFPSLPRTIDVGVDGVTLVGTYRAHDNTPADRFFKQGRSSANWQDMSFGPGFRYLLPYQQVARYNLYNSIALARPLSPNNYFLGYQVQPQVGAVLGGALGQGRPLGY